MASSALGTTLELGDLIACDMGGTSFEACLLPGSQPAFTNLEELEYGVPIALTMVDARAIGAGGGSIAWIDAAGILKVGPHSAGADPGPACYGRGGTEATVTDANVHLGRLASDLLLAGDLPLDADAALAVPDDDQLSFDLPAGDQCFKTLGKLPGTFVAGDQLVLNNYGFPDQNAYQTAGTLNRVPIIAIDTSEATRDRVSFAATTFVRALHDSPGKRFFVISGPVTYECDLTAGRIYRHSGYALSAGQPTAFGGTPALLAEHVTSCEFEYTPAVSAQLGLLTMRLQLQRQLFGGSVESIGLYHAVHVNNAP